MSCKGRVVQLLKGRWHAPGSLGMLDSNPIHMHCGQWVQSIGMKTGCQQRYVGIFGRSDPLIHMLGAASIAEHCSQIRECVSDFELTTLDCPQSLWLAHEPVLPFSGAACFVRVEPQSVLG